MLKSNQIVSLKSTRPKLRPIEIKQEIIGKEDINIELFKKGFEVLISSLARPAINIFIKSPRAKINRFKMIQEYQ